MKRLYITNLFALALLAPQNDQGSKSSAGGTLKFLGSADGPVDSGITAATKDVGNQMGKTTDGIKFVSDPEMLKAANTGTIGLTGKVAYVNKQGAEGLLAIDAFTGVVLMNDETPEWGTELGLVNALLHERHSFYASRLGQKYADDHVSPEVYAFEDLAWLSTVDDGADGTEAITDADVEHRMTVVATVLGVNRETGDVKGAELAAEFQSDNTRTEAELAALQEATQQPQAVAVEK